MQSRQRHLARRIGRLLGWVVGSVLLLLGIAFAYAQTPIAKDQISRAIAEGLSDPPNRTEISGLGGLLPFDVRVGRISLADDKGEWLRVEGAALELAPADLVAGRLRAKSLGADRITLERLPETADTSDDTGPGFAVPAPPAFPESLPPVTIDRLYVNSLELGPAVAGEKARFRLEGALRGDAEGRRADARLALQRTDREGTEAS
ncbi:MAG TPA: hypothetical protein ENJ38_07660, partial [Rhodospirillales bacterium]|nr:hypothetical protein [Rhodospirillales bacterium]